ncbi:hypothetical protein GCM10022213_26930 [Parerythrobacter jejuensis]
MGGEIEKGSAALRYFAGLPLVALVAAVPAMAQDTSPEPSPEPAVEEARDTNPSDTRFNEQGEIVVTADRIPGQLDVPQAPLVELDAEDIAGFGVGSIQELVAQLEPATGSARGRGGGGRPVFLINGIRVSSFREFFRYPPEALRKVEVLPEEVAQRFGFPPDRRVINFILKDDFRSREVEVEYEQPDRGGYSRTEQEFGLLAITGGGRLNFNFEHNDTSLLTEAERDIIQTPGSFSTVPGDPDPAAARSLVADSRGLEGTINWAKSFTESGASLSLSGNMERQDRRSLSGLDTVTLTDPAGNSVLRTFNDGDPLEVNSRTDSANVAIGYARPLGSFQLTATANGALSGTRTRIDRRADTRVLQNRALFGAFALDAPIPPLVDPGFDTANTDTVTASTKVTLRGRPLRLPAGELGLTFDVGYNWNSIDSDDTRSATAASLTRGVLEAGVNVAIPLTSRRENALGAIGDFSLNLQAGIDHFSDFGTLRDYSVSLIWKPFDDLQLAATYVDNEQAPSLFQLGNPQITSFNVPVFDLVNGRTELVTLTSGGNPDLLAESQRDWKFSGNWKLPIGGDVRLNLEYIRNKSDNVTSSFPALTEAIEAAFPERITRDATGRLTALDFRPVTFAETRANRLSIGLNMRGQIGKKPERPSGPPPGVRGGGQPGGPPAGRPGRPPADGASGPPAPAATGSQAARGGGPGTGRGGGGRFQAMRERFCNTPEGQMPDLTGVPEPMLARLRGPDGELDPEKVKQAQQRFCGERGQQDMDRFAQLREKLCKDEPDLEGLPEPMLARLRGPDGTIDPERLKQVKQRICADGDAGGEAGASGQRGGPPAQARGGGRRGGGFNPFGGGGRGGDTRPRYFLSLNHTIELDNSILIAPGVPVLDQLDGDATSTFGLPENSTRLEAGIFWNGYGMRVSGRYVGSAFVQGSGLPGSTDLFIDDLATVGLRAFVDFGRALNKDKGFLKGFRVSVRADNIFDGRRIVRDQNGDIPLRFQPLLVDPTGRYLGIDLRKLF